MKNVPENFAAHPRKLLSFVLVGSLLASSQAEAAGVALATAPLATSTTSTVKPNVMFILDDSGSMNWDFLPDYVSSGYCKTTAGTYTMACCSLNGTGDGNGQGANATSDSCFGGDVTTAVPKSTYRGHPPYLSSGFNGVMYNPAIRYEPPVLYNADGTINTTTYPSQTTWTSVKNDGYGVQSTTTINLTTNYPDQEWCTDNTFADCLRNDNYILPGVVNSKTYNTYRATTGTGVGSVATGQPDAPTVAARTFGPHYYTINPGEFCDSESLKNCQVTATATFRFPASVRWCNSAAAASASTPAAGTCQGLNSATFNHARYPTRFFTAGTAGSPAVPAVPASPGTAPSNGTIRITGVNRDRNISFQCGTTFIGRSSAFRSLNSGTASARLDDLFSRINGSTVNGYTMTCARAGSPTTSMTCSVAAPVGPSACSGGFTIDSDVSTSINTGPVGGTNANPGSPFIPAVPASPAAYFGSFTRVDIVPSRTTYPKAASRTDCAGATCSYNEEMTNFANWWAYYHTRMQNMKSAVSRSFKALDDRFRVGFVTINERNPVNSSTFLGVNTFELAHKRNWYTTMLATKTPFSTALRGSLSMVGRYFGNKLSGQTDPIQHSCQQNFAFLSTDGYWNDSSTAAIKLDGSAMTNQDGGTTARPLREGTTATANSLADVAKYYYDTDLRTSALGNCTGATSTAFPAGNPDVCENNVFISETDKNTKQHMTTFTVGLGIDGTLNYTSDYLTATSGDFFNLKNGFGTPTVNWPDPIANSQGERIDDLWHAAVNGNGLYFSARNPDQIIDGFKTALSSITKKLGAAAAAATSTLNPVAGNNFAYVASYTTNVWKGNLESRSINTVTGVVSETATWCVENVPAQSCPSPGTVVADTSGSSTIFNCVVTGATAGSCTAPGVFDSGTSTCKTEISNACTGTMASKVAAVTDTRNIYTANASGSALVPFDAAYAAANPTPFSAARISTLSQWATLSPAQQTAATGVNLVNYLRGQSGFEDRVVNAAANRLYRAREATLGDALESQPAFISKPIFSYPYPGYSTFKSTQASRPGTVYMGTNDGMMHAFAADTGAERWAYIPSMVIPNLWKLADINYAHVNYVNGSPITTDICTANCTNNATAVWKTILVGGLSGGGRGYYALDITDPVTPSLLWEFTPAQDSDLGYSFGLPVVTRKADGTWVVIVTSGYDNGTQSADLAVNNTPVGTGRGYLYVLNASTGAIISKISTGVGSATTPSGLAKFAVYNDDPSGNLAGYAYGGDLFGNLWRFDINATTSATLGTGSVMKFAELKAPDGTAQPITTSPVLAKILEKRVILVGTGKYLETSDLTNTQIQTQYAIKDDDATTTLVNPRASLVQQTLTNAAGVATRNGSNNPVNFGTGRGWYVDFPDSKERVNIDSRLIEGTLILPTIVPSNTVCTPGGFGWLNFLNFETGGAIDATGKAGAKYDSTIVGVNVIFIGGKPIVETVTSTNPTPEKDPNVLFRASNSQFVGKRVLWREMKR